MTVSSDSGKIIRIKLLRGSTVIRVYKIASDSVTIGSDSACTLKMAGDKTLLPRHATLYQQEGEITVVPESGALVLLNDEPVDFAVVEPTDVVRIGKMSFHAELVVAGDSIVPASGRQSKAPSALPRKSVPPKPAALPSMPAPPVAAAVSKAPPVRAAAVSVAPATSNAPRVADAEKSTAVAAPASPVPASAAPVTPAPAAASIHASTAARPASDTKTETSSLAGVAQTDSASSVEYNADDYFFDDSDDPTQDEFFFFEPFDLTAALTKEDAPVPSEALETWCAADIVRIMGGKVIATDFVRPGQKFRGAFDPIRCYTAGNNIHVVAGVDKFDSVQKGGQRLLPTDLPSKKGRAHLVLRAGDSAVMHGNGGIYQINAYHPPVAPKKGSLGFNSSTFLTMLGGAVVLHAVLGLMAFAVFPGEQAAQEAAKDEDFAVVEMEKPEFKKDKEEQKKPEPKPVEKDATMMAERAPQVSNRTVKRIRERAIEAKPTSSVSSLLTVLTRGSGKEGKTDNIRDLVSNIDAVGVGSGSAAYNIAGAIASLPGGDVNVARQGGGGAVATLSGEQVAGANSKIAELVRKKPSGKIRGKVTKMTSGAQVKGSLSKEDVSRVVNSNINAVQACYEKALLSNPGLSGRIVFDWTVKPDGRVSGVRVRSSTLSDSGVSTCISNNIKKWKFPRPTGGEVVVTYPFLFRSVSS